MKENSLKKLIDLAKIQGNKFFVLDENAEPVLVMMSVEEYENLLTEKLAGKIADVEQINREIIEIQKSGLSENNSSSPNVLLSPEEQNRIYQDQLKSEVIDSTFEFEFRGDQEEI